MAIRASLLRPLKIFKDHRSADISIGIGEVRGATGLVTTATPADNVWAYSVATNVHSLVSNTADGATKTANGAVRVKLPSGWKTGQTLTVRLSVKLVAVTGTGVADNGSDIDVLAFKQTALAISADLCSTAAQTFAATNTRYDKDFTIDPASLAADDVLNINVVGRAIENDAGNGTLQVQLEKITLIVGEPS